MGRSPGGKRQKLLDDEEQGQEIGQVELAAMALHEALHLRNFENFPKHPDAWKSYKQYHRLQGWSTTAIMGLLLLTLFETPLWCRSEQGGYWDLRSSEEKCSAASTGRGPPAGEVLMSGLPLLPLGASLTVEYVLLGIVLGRVLLSAELHNHFRGAGNAYRTSEGMILDYLMILLGFSDVFYFSFFPTATVRIAPFVRFGLAATIPWVSVVITSFIGVTKSIVTVGCFLMGTIVIFAWVAAMIFDDLAHENIYGIPINKGFETFGNALYTMFATMTTAILPDIMVPSYAHNRWFLLFWMPFFLLAVCIFTQVILATVYNEYGEQVTERMKSGHAERQKGIQCAFNFIKASTKIDKNGREVEVVQYDAFEQLVKSLRDFKSMHLVSDEFMQICFDALDDDKSQTLSLAEFRDMCSVLLTKFTVTERDSCVRKKLADTDVGRQLEAVMTNASADRESPDLGCCPPAWTASKFAGSPFDRLMNAILGVNVVWLVVQSVYDLNDVPEYEWFSTVDLIFCFAYAFEVVVKLCWWSFPEYWMSGDNRFDFVTTVVLVSAGMSVLFFDLNHEYIRYLNLLRLVRLLKALNNIPEYERTVEIISRMVTTCGDVLAMNVLMIYLWSAWGLQIFGGQLYQSNPALQDKADDLDYFSSNYEVYNFNDMLLAMVTMFFITMTSWNDPITCVCLSLYDHYSLPWWATGVFWWSFYVGSVLIAFNVFTALSIDVFCKAEEMSDDNMKKTDVELNLEKLQNEWANKGLCLHIEESAELHKEKVYRAMFEEDEDAEKDEDEESSDP